MQKRLRQETTVRDRQASAPQADDLAPVVIDQRQTARRRRVAPLTGVGAHAAVVFLLANDVELTTSPRALAAVTLATARGEMSGEALAIWFRQRSRTLPA